MSEERSTAVGSGLTAAMAMAWALSQGLIRQRMSALGQTALAVLEGDLDPPDRAAAERQARMLASSLCGLGMAEGARVAQEIEWLLRGSLPAGGDGVLRLSELVMALGQHLEEGPAGAVPLGLEYGADVLIVDADVDFARQVVDRAVGCGMRPAAVQFLAEARDRIANHRPALVVLDPANVGDLDAGRSLLAELCGAHQVPTIVLTSPGGLVDRAEAARAGGVGFLEKPVPPGTLVEVLARTVDRLRGGWTALVADPDPTTAVLLGLELTARGCRVESVDDPWRFWEALEQVRPEALVVAADCRHPQLDGVQLCRMVRNDTGWSWLPVVFVSEQGADPAAQRAMFAAGADDVLPKPLSATDLGLRVRNRVERCRVQRGLAEVDPRTGLASWQGFVRETERLLGLARRYRRHLAVMVLEVDDLAGLVRRYGWAAGQAGLLVLARLLRRSVRAEDVVGMHGDGRVVAAVYGWESTDAVGRLAQLVEAYRLEEITAGGIRLLATASAGVASFPDDGPDLRALATAAAVALDEATAAGGDRVEAAVSVPPDGPAGADFLDVLLVDEDEVVAPLLVRALASRGYRTRWVTGVAEAGALLGAADRPRVGVVLLDAATGELPGGPEALEPTRLITIVAPVPGSRGARDTGGYDRITKPVSIPLLLDRVRRALEP